MSNGILTIPGNDPIQLIRPLWGFMRELEAKLAQFPFDDNICVMMPFREKANPIWDTIKQTVKAYGMHPVRADEWIIINDAYNPIAVLSICKYGIAVFDKPEPEQAFNPNVIYELAMMHSQNKDCLILKQATVPAAPFDLIGQLQFTFTNLRAVEDNIRLWLAQKRPPSTTAQAALALGVSQSTVRSKFEKLDLSPHKDDSGHYKLTPAEFEKLKESIQEPGSAAVAEVKVADRTLEASDFGWSLSGDSEGNTQRVTWKLRLRNTGSESVGYDILLLLQDSAGFLLWDRPVSTRKILKPNEEVSLTPYFDLPAVYATRLNRIEAQVSRST